MTPDELYEKGYADGAAGVAASVSLVNDEHYQMGYQDGKGDDGDDAVKRGTKSAFIGNDFVANNEAPKGYKWTGEYRTPQKGEIYLTKAGNAGVAKDDPKNGRKRHMLVAIIPCANQSYYWHAVKGRTAEKPCGFTKYHAGQHSHALVKR